MKGKEKKHTITTRPCELTKDGIGLGEERNKAKKSGRRYSFFFFFFFCTLSLSSFWTSRGHRCRPFSPPVLAFNFYRAEGSAIPLLVDFSSSVANSRSRAFRKSICPQEKVPTNLYEYALGGARTHETDQYQARG